jgi:hypothetical protein
MGQTETCRKCAAIVDANDSHRHRRFHSDLEDLERRVKNAEQIARRAARG